MRALNTVFFACVAIALVSCGTARKGPVVVRFWSMGNEGEMVRQLIPEFEKENPGIIIDAQQIPWTAAHEKLLTAYAGDATPDVSQLGNTWIPEFTVLNALEPLDEYARRSSTLRLDDFFEGVLKTNVIDSVLYGIPWYVDTRVIFYRKDLLNGVGYDAPPATWDETLRLCDALQRKARSKGIVRYPIFLPTSEWVPAIILGMQAGGDLLKDDRTAGNFSGPDFKKAFMLLAKFYQMQYSPSGQQLITNLYNSFSEGLITMYITGPWNIGEFSRRLPQNLQGEWMTAPMPSMDEHFPGASLPLGTSLVVFRASKKKAEAWKFIEYLASTKQSIAFYKITGSLPPRKSAWEDTTLSANRYVQAFYKQLQRLDPLPPVPEWEQIVIKLQLYVEYIATNTLTVDEALRRFDAEVNQMLAKRRWLVEKGIVK
ncbi:MAG TPA: sugar ABC transporter substrate-binding protein [Bacteroidota bacterium]